MENQCDSDDPLSSANFDFFDDLDDYHLGSNDNKVSGLNSSSNDEGLSDDNMYNDECLESSCDFMVNNPFELPSLSLESFLEEDLGYDFAIIYFHDPCEENYWHKFQNPHFDASSIENEGMLDEYQYDVESGSALSMLSFHPPKDKIDEPNSFPSVGFDLFKDNMLEERIGFLNDQGHGNSFSLEVVDENFPSKELLFTYLKFDILDDDKYDSTQIVLIDSHVINIDKTFEENHKDKNNPFEGVHEMSGQSLKLIRSAFDPSSGESQPFYFKSNF